MNKNVYFLESDMKYFADMLREKMGTNELLQFPNDFVNAYDKIMFYGKSNCSDDRNYVNDWLEGKFSEHSFGISSFSNSPFMYNQDLRSIHLPLLEAVPSWFFTYASIQYVDIPKASFIGSSAFRGNSMITECYAPSCNVVHSAAFYLCSSLQSVVLGKGQYMTHNDITMINAYAFYNCYNLSYISIPGKLVVGNYGFAGCSALESISSFQSTYTIYSHAFEKCIGLKEITVDSWGIGQYAFSGCTSLSCATMYGQEIESSAFLNCTNLSNLYLRSYLFCSLRSSNAFSGTPILDGSIYVRQGLIDKYRSASNWSYFSSRFVVLSN